jgi:F-type H+-transporting ATPase subunit gamma
MRPDMASIRQIRQRIRTAKNIQQITKAMKMVAAARLNRAQVRVKAARPYSDKMREVMASLSRAGAGTISHPLLEVREPVKIGILAVTADRGLCGSYAANILKKTVEVLKTCGPAGGPVAPENVQLLLVGRKGHAFFKRRPYPIAGEFNLNMTDTTFAEAQAVARKVRELYGAGEIDVLYLVYTQFVSALTQRPLVVKLLPIVPEETDGAPMQSGGEDYLFEPDAEGLLERILPRTIDTAIYQALLDAVASEHGSRMTAMSSATDNAGKMISGLTLQANRARQAAITKEISEIVGGSEALRN